MPLNLKSGRLKLVLDLLNSLNSLCLVLGLDFQQTVKDVQITLDDSSTRNINVDTVERLSTAISDFRGVKIQRMQKVSVVVKNVVLVIVQIILLYLFFSFKI